MLSQKRAARLAVSLTLGLVVAACGSSAASVPPGSTATATEPSVGGGGALADVDVCKLATTAEITQVMGLQAHDPQSSAMGPGASIDGSAGCFWQLGDSIDIFDAWIYPSSSADLKTALGSFWTDGYAIEPIAGVGDEAFAAVWRGDAAMRTVGQIAGVGVRQGDKSILLSTLLIGEDYTDPKPAAELALTMLGRA
jgi:hypothetical protein